MALCCFRGLQELRRCRHASAITQKVRREGAAFYWHLGDYRAIYDFDQDFRQRNRNASISTYENEAWPDFIEQQLRSFADLPVYLALGNHETIAPKTRAEAILTIRRLVRSSGTQEAKIAG